MVTRGTDVDLEEVPDPRPAPGEVLMEVHAAGLCGPDHLRGSSVAEQNREPTRRGYEAAGVVVGLGEGARRFQVGDRVMGMVWSGHAELSAVDERWVLPVPDEMSMAEAGGFDDAFCTSDDAMFTQCELSAGERVLITGAAGGVGMAAVQLAHIAGAKVVASVRDESKRNAITALGATTVIADEAYEHGPFDVVLELASGAFVPRDLESLAMGGRLSLIGLGGQSRVEVDFRHLSAAYGHIVASSIRRRTDDEKALIHERAERRVLPLLREGKVRVLLDSTFPLTEACAAYRRFAAGGNLGKVVLVMR